MTKQLDSLFAYKFGEGGLCEWVAYYRYLQNLGNPNKKEYQAAQEFWKQHYFYANKKQQEAYRD